MDADGAAVCRIFDVPASNKTSPTPIQAQANARLIAAAPDLLAALTNLVADMAESHADEIASNHHGDGPSCSYCREIAIARAAIAAAEGRG